MNTICKFLMASRDLKFSFTMVGCSLGYFPIICKCRITCVGLGIYFVKLEWLLKFLNFHLQRLVMNWGIFLSVVDVAYHLLNLVFIWQNLNGFWRSWISFAKVDYGLGCFPIIFRCWISFVELGIYFSQFEWLLKILIFICKGWLWFGEISHHL